MAAKATNVKKLQKAGILATRHNITQGDQDKINSLTTEEVSALISAKNKLGESMLKKTAKGGKFPHADSFSY
jgi:predicted transcriptional regulator